MRFKWICIVHEISTLLEDVCKFTMLFKFKVSLGVHRIHIHLLYNLSSIDIEFCPEKMFWARKCVKLTCFWSSVIKKRLEIQKFLVETLHLDDSQRDSKLWKVKMVHEIQMNLYGLRDFDTFRRRYSIFDSIQILDVIWCPPYPYTYII